MKIKLKKALSAILAFVLVLTAVFTLIPAPSASAATQSEINSLKQEQNGLKSQESDVQSTINSLKGKQNSTMELKTALDQKNSLTLQQILNLNQQIDIHEELIKQKTEEVDDAQKVADEQLEKYKVRIRNMEENGRFSYLEVLFGASSIGEFLSLIDDIGDIMKSDKELEDSYLAAVSDLKAVKAEYEAAQKDLKDKKAELESLSAQLLKDISEASAVISALQSDINANADVLAELAAQDKALQSKINAKVKELNEQQKKEQQQQQQQGSGGNTTPVTPSGSGKLSVWPSYTTYITSVQGNRVHPVTGQYGTHGGTDIGASYGSAIYASGSGTVVTAYNDSGYNGGYGNYVIIDHGGGVQTLYAHMSVCAVSVGQSVSAGQVIGYVGSTGRVTGAHLHFEVWANGSRQDPQSYFPGLGYAYSPTAWGG